MAATSRKLSNLREIDPMARRTSGESSKRRAFRRIAEPRLANVLNLLGVFAQTADRTRYEFVQADIDYFREVLTQAVDETIDRFERGTPRPNVRLPDLPGHPTQEKS